MSWILFAILATVTWAIVNIIDKYILTKLIREPVIPIMVGGIISLLVAVFVYFIRGYSELSLSNIFLALIAGAFYIGMILFYFKAVKIEEVSRIIPVFNFRYFFLLILASIFLGEVFTPMIYLGLFLLIVGAVLIYSKDILKIGLGKAFWFMILASISTSIGGVIVKYLLDFADYWTIFSYARIGSFLTLIPVFCLNFPDLMAILREHGKKSVCIMSCNSVLNLAGVLFMTIAVSIGFVTLATTLSAIQPFFVLIFAVILSVFYPSILWEEIKGSTLLLKFISIVFMVVGAILVIQ